MLVVMASHRQRAAVMTRKMVIVQKVCGIVRAYDRFVVLVVLVLLGTSIGVVFVVVMVVAVVLSL